MVNELIYLIVMGCYILLIIIGMYLFYRMKKTKLTNLFGLAMFFILWSIQFFSVFFSPNLIYPLIAESPLLFLLIFIRSTFYRQTKSPFYYIFFLLLALKIIDSILRFMYNFTIPLGVPISSGLIPIYYLLAILVSIQLTLTMSWFSYSSIKSYINIRNYDIEPWIKKRYLIISISGIAFTLNGVMILIIPIEGGYDNLFVTIPILILIVIFSVGSLIAWTMPEKLKAYFNRNYQGLIEENLSETALLEKIKSELDKSQE